VASRPIAFLSDFGTTDEFVGVVKLVLLRALSDLRIVDLTHDIRPHAVAAGARALLRALPWLGGTVVLAVVDPGVGSERRGVAIEAAHPEGLVLVGPDNGLLLPAAEAAGGIVAAVSLAHRSRPAGPTFDGRDLFAPAAARLAGGSRLGALGPPLAAEGLIRLPPPRSAWEADGLTTEVIWVDRFGNLATAATAADLARLGSHPILDLGGTRHPLARAVAFADLPHAPDLGGLGLLVDSSGHLTIARREASAAALLGLEEGAVVRLLPG
jgi:S-adenosylmethionine hydrolase